MNRPRFRSNLFFAAFKELSSILDGPMYFRYGNLDSANNANLACLSNDKIPFSSWFAMAAAVCSGDHGAGLWSPEH